MLEPCDTIQRPGEVAPRPVRLLDLPRDIQDMISRGDLNKSHGEKILKLPEKKRDKLFNSLRAGEPVVKVLRHHGVINPATAKTPNQLGQELLDFLNHNVKKLDQNMEDLDRLQVRGAGALRVLDQSVDFLTAWRDRKQSLFGQSVDAIRPSCVGIRDAGQNDQNAR